MEWKSVDYQLLESYTDTLKPTLATVTPREVKHLKDDLTTLTLSPLLNGNQYTNMEARDILSVNRKLQ